MSDSTLGTGTDSAASSGGLGDEIAQLMGDFSSSSPDDAETPTSTTEDAAGETPAERPDDASDSPTLPDGTETAERAGEPPADAVATVPDEPDPLASATPFTYTVNGESRAFDGIKVLGEHGAIIDSPEALALLQRRLGERDHLFEQNREQYQRQQEYERLSEWRVPGPDGKEQVLSGVEGLTTMRVTTAQLAANLDTLASVFKDPAKFAQLVSVNAEGQIVPDPQALQFLLTQAELAETRAEQAVRSHLSAPRQEAPQTLTPESVAQAAPSIIQSAAATAQVDASVLTKADSAMLANLLPRYIRQVTPADVQANPRLKLGGPIVDEAFTELVKDRIALRSEVTTTAKATAQAAQDNAKKLAAAALGTRPAQRPATPVRPQPVPTSASSDDKWDLMERAAAGR